MAPTPCDKKKYARAKSAVYSKYKKHGAYRSMAVVKKYKSMGGGYCGGSKNSGGTTKWRKEKWRAPGGKKDFGGKKPGVFRPTVKVDSKTPKLLSSVAKKDRKKAVARKRSGHNAKY